MLHRQSLRSPRRRHEYRDEVSQSESDSVANSLVDRIAFEEIQQLILGEGADSSQPPVRDPESTLSSDLTAVLDVSEATQTTDTTVVENVPLFQSISPKEYLENQPL